MMTVADDKRQVYESILIDKPSRMKVLIAHVDLLVTFVLSPQGNGTIFESFVWELRHEERY
jgi:hypothetical protein